MPTIRQLADELGVTKEAIRKQAATLPPNYVTTGTNKTKLINSDGASVIRGRVSRREDNNCQVATYSEPTIEPVGTIVSVLQKELDSKNAIIESQSRQLESQSRQLEQAHQSIQDLTAALASAQLSAQQAQALHAGTMHTQLKGKGASSAPITKNQDTEEELPASPSEPEKKPGLFARILGRVQTHPKA